MEYTKEAEAIERFKFVKVKKDWPLLKKINY